MDYSVEDSIEIREEALPVFIRLKETEKINKKALQSQESISMESVEQIELLTEAALVPLDHSLENSNSEDPRERLEANLEGIKEALKNLGKLVKRKPKNVDEIKKVGGVIDEINGTFNKESWLKSQTFKEEQIDGGKWLVMFHHQGKVISDPARSLKKELSTLSEIVDKLIEQGKEYNGFIRDLFDDITGANTAEEAIKIFEDKIGDKPTSPLKALEGGDYELLGMAKDQTFPAISKKDKKPIFIIRYMDPEKAKEQKVNPLDKDGVKELAKLAGEFGNLYSMIQVKKPKHIPDTEGESIVKKLEENGGDHWEKILDTIDGQHVDRVSDNGLRGIEDHCVKLIYAIYHYLKESIT